MSNLTIDVHLDKIQLRYLFDLVLEDDQDNGPWISVEMLGILGEALSELEEAELHREKALDSRTGLS